MPNIIKSKPKKKVAPKKKKQTLTVPALPKTVKSTLKSKTSPTAYYNCLMNYAQQGFYDAQEGKKQKIHACCKKCKLSAPALNNQRDQELVKLITSYRQVGDSLAKLLHPIK